MYAAVESEWAVTSFLTALQHNIDYTVPYSEKRQNGVFGYFDYFWQYSTCNVLYALHPAGWQHFSSTLWRYFTELQKTIYICLVNLRLYSYVSVITIHLSHNMQMMQH